MRVRPIGLLVAVLFCCAIPARAQVPFPPSPTVVNGSLGPGALYRLVKPANWNGELVLYAHAYVPSSQPVALPNEADLIAGIVVPQGFALAYSSFSENGWAVKDGVQRTQQLLGTFKSQFGNPSRIYIGGASMGALIAIELVEKHPGWFDGMLAACAVTSSQAQADYMANVRAVFDAVYGNIPPPLPGDARSVPVGTNPAQVGVLAAAKIAANPLGVAAIAGIDQTPVPGITSDEIVQSIITAIIGNATFTYDLLPELHGKNYFDNSSVVYTGALPPAVLAGINATVDRFDAAPSAVNYLEQHYEPNGALQIPTVMLSTARDPFAPGFQRTAYANLVDAAGQSDFLVQREVNVYGHCPALPPTAIAAAFGELVNWVRTGDHP
jgi:pimeloyl-ACP methyl ester carboxylesterase